MPNQKKVKYIYLYTYILYIYTGHTPLQLVCGANFEPHVLNLLLARGANVNLADNNGWVISMF